ncbi:MAG: hypothetical protein H6509_16275 [Bryobacterales bacterium]|nr:hypothetical protein [Bryobacterales bacterium]
MIPSAADHRETSGLLAIPFAEETGDFLLYFRREAPEGGLGGDPTKAVVEGDRYVCPAQKLLRRGKRSAGGSRRLVAFGPLVGGTLRVSLLEVTLGAREAAVAKRNESRGTAAGVDQRGSTTG